MRKNLKNIQPFYSEGSPLELLDDPGVWKGNIGPIRLDGAGLLRAGMVIKGVDLLSTGTVSLAVFGKLGELLATVPSLAVNYTAPGIGTLIDLKETLDVRGLTDVTLKFAYDNGGATLDTVEVWGMLGVPYENPPK